MDTVTDDSVPAGELDVSSMQLGIDRLEISLQRREDVRVVAQAMAEQARQGLMLLTSDLEPAVFDQQPFLDALGSLLRERQDAQFRILLLDSRKVLQNGHRLLELSHRLGSSILFRRPPPEFQNTGKTFLLADDSGYFYRPLASRYEGKASFNAPGEVARLKKDFLELWERSEPDSELRLLHL